MIDGALGLAVDEGMKAPFTDMGLDNPEDLYPHNYMAAAFNAGIIQGKTPTEFSPWTDVTRAQAITMTVRAVQNLLPGTLQTPPLGYQGTLGAFDTTHAENARIAEYNHLLDGLQGFGPSWNTFQASTRAEAASMLAKLIELREARGVSSWAGVPGWALSPLVVGVAATG